MTDILTFTGDYRWLSNFWPAPVVYAGLLFPTVEHAYVAAKSAQIRMIGNSVCPDVAEAIVRANFPEVCEDRGQLAA